MFGGFLNFLFEKCRDMYQKDTLSHIYSFSPLSTCIYLSLSVLDSQEGWSFFYLKDIRHLSLYMVKQKVKATEIYNAAFTWQAQGEGLNMCSLM